MPEWYEVCAFCDQRIDFAGASMVLPENGAEPIYEPFMEDWRGGFVTVAHPRCFSDAEGVDALLAAVARSDLKRRSA